MSKSHPQVGIKRSKEPEWTVYFERKERNVDFFWCNIPKKIKTLSDLPHMLTSIQSLKSYNAVDFDEVEKKFSF